MSFDRISIDQPLKPNTLFARSTICRNGLVPLILLSVLSDFVTRYRKRSMLISNSSESNGRLASAGVR